jgi:hypothetical protein
VSNAAGEEVSNMAVRFAFRNQGWAARISAGLPNPWFGAGLLLQVQELTGFAYASQFSQPYF